MSLAISIDNLRHSYGDRTALDGVSLHVTAGEVFGLLGPNGSGKTTLFRILSTLIPADPGKVTLLGRDLAADRHVIRQQIGVVFQSPSLDKQLTARENLTYQGHLYGLGGAELRERVTASLATFGLADRADERVATFSGGMRRRVEVAKGLLHRPRLLLLDEPSTGLDPSARLDLWQALHNVSRSDGVTVLLTTHLMEEADKCDRLAVMAAGKVLASDTPDHLKADVGGDVISLVGQNAERIAGELRDKLGLESETVHGVVRIRRPNAHQLVPQLIEALPGQVDSVSVGKPTLEDVFIRLTGRRLSSET